MNLCRLLGHSREYHTVPRMRLSRRGYWYQGTGTRVCCRRCGVGGSAAYEVLGLDRARHRWWAVLQWWEGVKRQIRETYDPPADDGIPF